jgi:hypothetical protein
MKMVFKFFCGVFICPIFGHYSIADLQSWDCERCDAYFWRNTKSIKHANRLKVITTSYNRLGR